MLLGAKDLRLLKFNRTKIKIDGKPNGQSKYTGKLAGKAKIIPVQLSPV